MTDTLITFTPIILGLTFFVFFVLRGKTGLGIAGGVVIILGLWFMAQVLIIDYEICQRFRCSLDGYLRHLYADRGVFILPVVPVSVAVLISRFLVIKDKTLLGIVSGLGVILILWASAMASLLTCEGESLECEWVGVGVMFFTFLAILQSAAVIAISLAFRWSYRRSLKQIS